MRKSNIELLRIICILMVITLHYLNGKMGGALNNVIIGSFNYYLVHFIESLCVVAVNVFIIITGYFSYQRSKIKISKPIYLLYLSVIYGIIIYAILLIIGRVSVNQESLLKLLNSIMNRWFVIVYIVLYLLIPYINKLINYISQKNYKVLIVICVIFFYLWPSIYTDVLIKDKGYGIINFTVLYLIGAYIAKYKDTFISKRKTFFVYLLCVLITTILSMFYDNRAFAYNSIFNLIGGVSIFLLFKNMIIKDKKIINTLSSYSFSTYIIHENTFIVAIIFKEIFNSNSYYDSNYLIINLIISVLGTYFACIFIEAIRRFLMKKVDKKINSIKYEIEI